MNIKSVLFALLLASSTPSMAGPYVDELKKCLVESSSPRDMSNLVKWVARAISAHPNLGDLYAISENKKTEIDKSFAKYVERILLDSCKYQTLNLMRYENTDGLRVAFEFLGQVAMQQLMEDRNVTFAIGSFVNHIDTQRLERELGKLK